MAKTKGLVLSGLLIALAIVIPMFMPKFVMDPFSFTLASHVPVFIAVFISPAVACVVSLGSALGFFLSGLSPYVVARAATHVIFATLGAYLVKGPMPLNGRRNITMFVVITGILHALAEIVVILLMGFNAASVGVIFAVLGGGTFIHSALDFFIALTIYRALQRANIANL